jgi:hypothetical protein
MPWKVSSVMEERLRFVGRVLTACSAATVLTAALLTEVCSLAVQCGSPPIAWVLSGVG